VEESGQVRSGQVRLGQVRSGQVSFVRAVNSNLISLFFKLWDNYWTINNVEYKQTKMYKCMYN
jgi:hypothetical protein